MERETAAEAGRTASLRPEMELPARPRTATGWTATSDAIAIELYVRIPWACPGSGAAGYVHTL